MSFVRDVLGGSIGLFFVACGGATSNGSGGGDGGASGSCSVSAGTYTQHFTTEAGGSNCPSIPDQSLTINGNETITGGGGSGPADGGPGCTTNVDSSTCTVTTNCTTTASGFTSQVSTTITFSGGSATGMETISEGSAGQPRTTCTYDMTMTKG
jgi:hypothetical protein